ncbi:ApeP family dehydratase [Stenotrophobium rhamnosiphilum]|uniref:3-hydroxylacyl-ACP dehydratase n=1 Tax=Stenotrophobium rhamnosiphilum TaxID=2029166 RepID=A0A2T5MFN0_9GAMM|nr:3-hydroxylacyl-ACP dehydratase [Stenotrophobium rhamnosiphilum]PTU31405.1 3-hydroxylacyl-ACP dehydratase [Stenotrophobium rhamnosiphilum]
MTALRLGETYTPQQVLPHGLAMLLVEEVSYGLDYGQAALTIRADSTFCDGVDGVPAWVGIEYMAQAISVFSGVEQLQRDEAIKIGLLIGTRRYESEVPVFTIGSKLNIIARLSDREDEGISMFACEIRDDQRVLARGDIKAYRPNDIRAFLGTAAQ